MDGVPWQGDLEDCQCQPCRYIPVPPLNPCRISFGSLPSLSRHHLVPPTHLPRLSLPPQALLPGYVRGCRIEEPLPC